MPEARVVETLLPGQWAFVRSGALKTLLGSCVSILVWHRARGFGGMCHYLLPSRKRRGGETLDPRYGDEAMELMDQAMRRMGTRSDEYEAHLYGGADTLPDGMSMNFNVGERNIEMGMELVDRYGLNLVAVDVGDQVPRTVTLLLPEGKVRMVRGPSAKQPAPGLA